MMHDCLYYHIYSFYYHEVDSNIIIINEGVLCSEKYRKQWNCHGLMTFQTYLFVDSHWIKIGRDLISQTNEKVSFSQKIASGILLQ